MSIGEQIEVHLQKAQEARRLFIKLQGEAGIHAQSLSQLANRLNQIAREAAAALAGLNQRNMIFDDQMNRALASYPSRDRFESILTGMIAAANTLVYEQEELRKLGVQPAE